MCGIAGIVNFDGRPVEVASLKRMNDAQIHRGPDDEGTYVSEHVGVVHRRLAIIDLKGGHQPFVDEEAQVVLVYNGEVYNYKEIRQELKGEYEFRSDSDTEVILRSYQKWGTDCLQQFRGMFAFALYDRRKGSLFLARDRVGIKPLYYYHSRKMFVFGSELQSLLRLKEIPNKIDSVSLSRYFRYQYIPAPLCIYEHVHKLEPGCFLLINVHDGKVAKTQYWGFQVDIVDKDERTWLDELNDILDDTMRIYVRSDVPFGCFLSGGADSSLVTALMSACLNEPVKTFSIGFEEEAHSELQYAKKVSQWFQTDHLERIVSFQMSLDILEKVVKHFGEPFADSSAIPTYYVCREASSHVKMVLSGDGGDELFAGYDSYQVAYRDSLDPFYPIMIQAYKILGKCGILPRLSKWVGSRSLDPQEKHNSQREIFRDEELQELLLSYEDYPGNNRDRSGRDIDPVTNFQMQDFATYLPDDVLTKVDRMSMANSLEVRVPLLDHKVVEFAFSIPLSLKMRMSKNEDSLITKYLLKKSASRFFDATFLNRPKMGFGIPIVEWCLGAFKGLIEERLRDPRNPVFDYLDNSYVQTILNTFYGGEINTVNKVWFVLMFDRWVKNVHLER